MVKSDVDDLSRRTFLELSGLAIVGSTLGLSACQQPTAVAGEMVGANHAIGHLVRKAMSLPVSETISNQITIIGSGISGLAAGYFLQKAGIDNYQIIELEEHIGGNSAFGQDGNSSYPWAAHYLPIPSIENKILIDFLTENHIITDFDAAGLPIYDEYMLCFHPNERLFVQGYWQEGLVPNIGTTTNDQNQIKQFFALINIFKQAKGSDNKWAFTIPLADSSKDTVYTDLDKNSMADWLNKQGFTAKPLLWYINYCLLDDYGTALGDVSAWAGLHYFASRRSTAANAQSDDVLTWNEGNGFLMKLLSKNQLKHIKTKQLVYGIEEKNDEVLVNVYDWQTQKSIQYQSQQVIWAIPQMLRPYLLPQFRADFVKDFDYVPWLVANIQTKPFDTGRGQALSWDNVLYEGDGLGYILTNHQNINQHNTIWQLTYYKTLTSESSTESRKIAIKKTHNDWANEIIADLKKAHPNIEASILKIDIKIWGHAMARPVVGFIHGQSKQQAQVSINNKIHFAHSDLSGISIFEEAFYQGYMAAHKVISATQKT